MTPEEIAYISGSIIGGVSGCFVVCYFLAKVINLVFDWINNIFKKRKVESK